MKMITMISFLFRVLSLVTKQPNLFSELYEIVYYVAAQMLQLNEALERDDDDNELHELYKKLLSYKDTFNPGILSPLSAGSDTSLDGVRFFNGGNASEHEAPSGGSVRSDGGSQKDAKSDRLRGSSDLNACLIIAEAYNSGYKYLDLFAPNWNDMDGMPLVDSGGNSSSIKQSYECGMSQMDVEITEKQTSNAQNVNGSDHDNPCNGHTFNDIGQCVMIEVNGGGGGGGRGDGDMTIYKDNANQQNTIPKIPLTL